MVVSLIFYLSEPGDAPNHTRRRQEKAPLGWVVWSFYKIKKKIMEKIIMSIDNIKKPTKDQNNNILISDIGFTAEELTSDQSQACRSVNTTKILNGTVYTTQGEYLPMTWTFKTHLYYETGTEWNPLIKYLESGTHEVISPLIGEMFNATVRVTRVPVSHELMELSFTITEVPNTTDYTIDNSLYMGKHLSIQEVHDQEESGS